MASDSDTSEQEQIARLLIRYSDGERELYYAGGNQDATYRISPGEEIIGICTTFPRSNPASAKTRGEFEENVEEFATDIRWFDPPLTTQRPTYKEDLSEDE